MGVESLEGRALLSYLTVITRNHRVVNIRSGDARDNQPLFSNGLAVKHQPFFYPLYTGPKRPELNGVKATAQVTGNLARNGNLVLTGTVAGPIIQNPKTASQGAVYTFGIDRGNASEVGPFPGLPYVRFDAVVVAAFRTTGLKAYVQTNDPSTNQPGSVPTSTSTGNNKIQPLSSSAVKVSGNTITITVPLNSSSINFPSTGSAINQWNVNFFTRNPTQKPDFHSVASLTPGFTNFQVFVPQPH